MNTQEMLEEAIELWGLGDIVTKLLSIKRNEEIVVEQKAICRRYKQWTA